MKNGNAKQEQYIHHPVANVDLSQGVLFETYFGKPTGKIEGVAITVVVTNKTKEARYFNQPLFKVSVPIEGTSNSFYMTNAIYPLNYPVKLEYGQQYTISYKLVPENIDMFSALLEKDRNATIKAMVATTLDEIIESGPYAIAEIVDNSKYVK